MRMPALHASKLYLLKDDVVLWMRRWHWALRLHGEQGAESVHNILNTLERTYCAMRNPLDSMKFMLKEHMMQTLPLTAQLHAATNTEKEGMTEQSLSTYITY